MAARSCGFDSHHRHIHMGALPTKSANHGFFKEWSREMGYVFGYFIADGCISIGKGRKKNPYTFSITSKDEKHLFKIRDILKSTHKISLKNGKRTNQAHQIQIRSSVMARDLIALGASERKTYNLSKIDVPKKYFWDFVRGFFDGDGSVYIYNVNGVPQIKSNFVCASKSFIENLNTRICFYLKIPAKSVHTRKPKDNKDMIQYSIDYYVNDSEKLALCMYKNSPSIHMDRKKAVFDRWSEIKKSTRKFTKRNYPSKVGWHLNQGVVS